MPKTPENIKQKQGKAGAWNLGLKDELQNTQGSQLGGRSQQRRRHTPDN